MKPTRQIAVIVWSVFYLALGCGCAFADKRVALIVGNSAYVRTLKLSNPENDAQDLADALRKLNFEVILKTNVDKRSLDSALEEFERKARAADTALFFFAGHGLQYHGRNFLLPVDADLEDEVSLRYNTLAMDEVRDALATASGVKIMILDACRDNPLAKAFLSRSAAIDRGTELTRGLARLDRAEGLVVVYATQANQVAQDGSGRNSPFSTSLIHRLLEPNLEIATLFRRVAQDVYEQTGGRQRPELSISLLQDYYLNLQDEDYRAWGRVGPKATRSELYAFMERFPDSPFVRDAQKRLASLDMASQQVEDQRKADERRAICAREAAQINQLAETKQKLGLAQLKPQITCPGLQASIDTALATLAAAEEQSCQSENRMLQEIGKDDVAALKAFVDNAVCETARRGAIETIARTEAENAKRKLACQSATKTLAAIKARPTPPSQLRAELLKFQSRLDCAGLTTEVANTIAAVEALEQKDQEQKDQEQQKLDKVRARLAAIEEAKRKDASEAVRGKAACDAESGKLAAIEAKQQAPRLLRSELAEFQAHLACASLAADVATAIKSAESQEQLNLDRLRARLAAIEADRQKAEGAAAAQTAACQAEAERLAKIKAQPRTLAQIHADLTELQTRLVCARLKPELADAIKDVETQEQQRLDKVRARLRALEAEHH